MSAIHREIPSEFSVVAVISDIHANGPALEAVLSDIPKDAFIICLGDLVGYYTEPEKVCRSVREKAHAIIRGNHDAYVLGDLSYPEAKEGDYRIGWTKEAISIDTFDWLSMLPTEIELKFGNQALIMRHANLKDELNYIYPNTDISDIHLKQRDILLLGHTHHPMLRQAGEGRILNPGSVGQPRDRKPGAAYALINPAGEIAFRRVPYNIAAYEKTLRLAGVEEKFVAMLSRQSAC